MASLAFWLALAVFTGSMPFPQALHGASNSIEKAYSERLDSMPMALHFADVSKSRKKQKQTIDHCKSVVYQSFQQVPGEHTENINDLTLSFDPRIRRGLSGGGKMVIRCAGVSDRELTAVILHEIGHTVDTALLQGSGFFGDSGFMDFGNPVFDDDPSAEFYRFSWNDSSIMRDDALDLDFVSGYAMTDPFEDFAETYMYYRLHGPEFRYLAEHNPVLSEKYAFMRDQVFFGEYGSAQEKPVKVSYRPFDATLIPY